MKDETLVAQQIVRLFQQRPGIVWELVEAPAQARATDVVIRDAIGQAVVVARRAAA